MSDVENGNGSNQRCYTLREVAGKLGTTQKAIRRLVASGELKSAKSGSAYTIDEHDLTSFIDSQKTASPAEARVHMDLFGVPFIPKGMRWRPSNMPDQKKDVVNWTDISAEWDAPEKTGLTFVDLFCGCGGLSKGLEMSGLEGVCGLDWFAEAGMTYERNFGHPFVNGDIKRQENKQRFYETVGRQLNGRHLNIVVGGFPCQGFSMAGNRIVDDPRNSLYLEMLEIVRTLQPDFVVCENVKGLRSMLDGAVERKIVQDFKEIGYDMNVTTLCAADYHTPQKRERVIFIGNRIGATNYHPAPLLTPDKYRTTGQAIGDLMDRSADPSFNHVPTKHRQDMVKRMAALPEGESLYKGYSDAWKKCPWGEASCTIKENHGGVNIHPKLPRVLTAREMARLQSFPDDFIFEGPKNKQLVQIGNAVPPLLGKAIGLALINSYRDFTTIP